MPADFATHIETVACHLLGEPNRALSSRTDWRYGTRGSLAVDLQRGTWYDHEQGVGGGVIDLIHREIGLADGAAVAWMKSELGIRLDEQPNGKSKKPSHLADERRVVAAYDYRDEAGALLFQVVRFEPKDFRQRRPDGNGGWTWSVKGIRPVPYRLPELLKRSEGAPVYIVEGEKDADRLAKLGLVATCNAGGASEAKNGKGKWRPELNQHFRGATVYVLPDNDEPGRAHAQQIAANLYGTAASVRIVELPGLDDKQDVSNWLHAGGTVERLAALCRATPPWEPIAEAAEGTDTDFAPRDIEDLDEGKIPPRQWLLSTILCRRFVTVLAASGGSGKTTLILAWALSLATGRALIGDHVHKRSRVLVLTFEDDIDEYRRRLRAARMHHKIGAVGRGWCHVVPLAGIGITLASAGKDGALVETDAAQRIMAVIRLLQIDAVFFDPLVKLSDADENDNRAADFVARILVRIAIEANVAVLVAHHFRKGLAEAGNIDAARGARAIIDASRSALTLLPMSGDEAKRFGINEQERRRLVRMDDGKANLVLAAEAARWYRLASVAIGNATDDYPHGDNVQAVERWQPPDVWDGLSHDLLNRILDKLDAGMPAGERYSAAPSAKKRAAWHVVQEEAPDKTEPQCRQVIATWLGTGLLRVEEYDSPTRRERAEGVVVDPSKRPSGGAR